MFKGSLVAIVSPMFEDGSLDLRRTARLIDCHIAEGTDGIVIVGTTGESPTVDFEEHCQLIKTSVEHVAGRVPVIAGTGANSTREAIELPAFAKQAGRRHEPVGRAVLQQADPGRAVSPFQGNCGGGGHADDPVQRSGSHRVRHAERYGAAARAGPQHRRASRMPPATSSAAPICCAARRRVSRSTAATTEPGWRC